MAIAGLGRCNMKTIIFMSQVVFSALVIALPLFVYAYGG